MAEKEHGEDVKKGEKQAGNSCCLWAETIFTARLPNPQWILSKCSMDDSNNTVKLSWTEVKGAFKYVCLSRSLLAIV